MIQVPSDSVEYVQKQYGFGDPGAMEEAVNILNDWIQKQAHFRKKNFSPHYLKMSIIARKGSIEKAKVLLDRYCTMRTLMPEYFGVFNAREDFSEIHKYSMALLLPKLTPEYYRIVLMKFIGNQYTSPNILSYYRLLLSLADYLRSHDYPDGCVIIFDLADTNIMDLITNVNFIEFKQVITICMEAYGVRVRAIHVITPSKFIDSLLSIIKPLLSKKLASRIQVNKSADELFETLPRDIMPKDYGGNEKSLQDLQDVSLDILSSEKHMEYLREMSKAGTDESCRPSDKFNEQYAGVAGTFRSLKID